MKITEENFDKLKQNSRIEYLLRLDRIENKFGYLISLGVLKAMVMGLLFLVGIDLIVFAIRGFTLELPFAGLMFIFFFILCASIGIDIANGLTKKRLMEDLHNKFFNIKVEVKPK